MRKFILVFLLYLIPSLLFSQDVVLLKHTNYISLFSKSKRYPVYVEWWLTKDKLSCINPLERKNDFKPDPLLYNETNLDADYLKSGYDRGHMSPAADNLCLGIIARTESNYFSNIAPQTHTLNAGDWNSLEMLSRRIALDLDSIHIWAGNIGEKGKIGNVSIPTHSWKVIYFKKTNSYKAYLFENKNTGITGILDNEVNVEKIMELTGFRFQ